MLRNKITYLILSCDKFSDLWDANLKMLRSNWPDRTFETFIVTDKETDRTFPDANIIAAGSNLEWSDRLKYALQYVKTDYLFLTLDDYFLVEKVDYKRIEHLVSIMEKDDYSYIRLFKNPKKATGDKVQNEEDLYYINNEVNYSVNLYSGLWSKHFFSYCLKEPRTAWMFEVTLHESAIEYGAHCLVSYSDDYKILDVVRKGKILRSAARYFKKHPGIYDGNREVQSLSYEVKLFIKTFVQEHTPAFLFKFLRKVYVKLGGQSFTYQYDNEKKPR